MICPHCQQEVEGYFKICENCKIPADTSRISDKYLLKLKVKAGLVVDKKNWFEKILQGKKETALQAKQRKEMEKLNEELRRVEQLKKAAVSSAYKAKVVTQDNSSGAAGNFIFIVLHVMAVLFGFVLLFFTIPAHLIYLALLKK